MERRDDAALVEALQAGEEDAFAELVDRYGGGLRRFVMSFVRTPSVADDVVQDTWLAVVRGIDRFEGRSSVKTWLYRIAANIARTRAVREGRSVPFSSLALGSEGEGPSVDPERFLGATSPASGHWATVPIDWGEQPEARLLSREVESVILNAIAELPPAQRAVITLRDVDGFASGEVAELIDLSEGNERVLLHRARSRVRASLERYFDEGRS